MSEPQDPASDPENPRDGESTRPVAPQAEEVTLTASSLQKNDAQRSREFQHPTHVGHYKILKPIGEGGMGTVYLAEQTAPIRRKVALKLIKLGMDTKQVVIRFESERQALALMDHPHVAKVFDAGATEQGRPYFVMEYVPGIPITEYCDKHRLTTKERLTLFMQVCHAIQHAHQKGIIHRDIKPSNVLVSVRDNKAVPKVIDFGVAKATQQKLTEKTLFTELGQLVGTPAYMSPEQADMTALDIDTRSDIYSLGVMLYELLAGALPFEQSSLRQAAFGEIQRIIREQEPPKPSTRLSSLGEESGTVAQKRSTTRAALEKQLHGDLDWITMKALEKDRTRRYATATEFAADILRHLSNKPVYASPPSAAYRAKKFIRRNRGMVISAAIIFLVLVAGIVGTGIGLSQALSARDAEARQRQIAETQRGEAKRQAQIAKAVNEFLNKDLLASVSPEEKGRRVTVREVLDVASKKIEGKFQDAPLVEAHVRFTMGNTYYSLGEDAPAMSQLERALVIFRRVLGDDQRDTLASMIALGVVYFRQGYYDKAEPLFLEALRGCRRFLGEDHSDTLMVSNDLAGLYRRQDKLKESQAIYTRVLKISRRVLGEKHPDTLLYMHNLALVYESRGLYDKAEPLLIEALGGFRRLLGEDHPKTLNLMGDLAAVYSSQGRYDQAKPLLVKALESKTRILGEGHPQTQAARVNLELVYIRLGQYDKAAELLADESKGHEDIPSKALNRVRSLNFQAAVLSMRAQFSKAESLLNEAMVLSHHTLGESAPDTLATMTNLANVYQGQHLYREAETAYLKVLEVSRRVHGDDNLESLRVMSNLARVYERQSRYRKAESLLVDAFKGRRRVLGEKHPDTLRTMGSLTRVLGEEGKLEEARPLVIKLITFWKQVAERPGAGADDLNEYAMVLSSCQPADLRDPATALSVAKKLVKMTGGIVSGYLDTLALAYAQTGQTDEAIKTETKALALLPPGKSSIRDELEKNLKTFRVITTTQKTTHRPSTGQPSTSGRATQNR